MNGGEIMKVKVDLYVAVKVFHEIAIAANYEDVRKTAIAKNPTERVISVNALFK